MTFRATCEIDFCYGHRLVGYRGSCRHLHGHNGKAVIVLQAAELDDRGMVRDFGEVRRAVKERVDRQLDHRMLLRRDDPLVPLLREQGEPLFLMDGNPTAENIARLLFGWAKELGFPVVEVRLHETASCWASYRE